jgi:SAM-dependent methyltransferase
MEKHESSASFTDSVNSEFWNDLCGSTLARSLGVKDASVESLARFDDWYFNFYAYLLPFVDLAACKGKRTLEVGLGYGSLSQQLANAGAIYTGLDIAPGPVAMVNHRLLQNGLSGQAVQGSVLSCPFPDRSFETAVLRHAQWAKGRLSEKPNSSESERKAYDADAEGNAAPETDFCTTSELRAMMSDNWSIDVMRLENVGDEGPLRLLPRRLKLWMIGPWSGLDIYLRATRR